MDSRNPVQLDAELIRQFEAMGAEIAPGVIPAEPAEIEGFKVLPENWTSLCTFLACETQWRVAATMAGMIWLGLDYPGADVVLRRSGVADTDAVFADLQVMEDAALDIFRETVG